MSGQTFPFILFDIMDASVTDVATLKRVLRGGSYSRRISLSLTSAIYSAMLAVHSSATFICSEDTLDIQSRDITQVMVMDTQLGESVLSEYTCNTPIEFSVAISPLIAFLQCGPQCHLSVGADAKFLIMTFPSPGMPSIAPQIFFFLPNIIGKSGSRFQIGLSPPRGDYVDHSFVSYPAEFSLPATDFTQIIRQLGQLSDCVQLHVDEHGVRFGIIFKKIRGTVSRTLPLRSEHPSGPESEGCIILDDSTDDAITFCDLGYLELTKYMCDISPTVIVKISENLVKVGFTLLTLLCIFSPKIPDHIRRRVWMLRVLSHSRCEPINY